MKNFKRQFYIEQLRNAGVKEIDGRTLELADERKLKHALMLVRVKES